MVFIWLWVRLGRRVCVSQEWIDVWFGNDPKPEGRLVEVLKIDFLRRQCLVRFVGSVGGKNIEIFVPDQFIVLQESDDE